MATCCMCCCCTCCVVHVVRVVVIRVVCLVLHNPTNALILRLAADNSNHFKRPQRFPTEERCEGTALFVSSIVSISIVPLCHEFIPSVCLTHIPLSFSFIISDVPLFIRLSFLRSLSLIRFLLPSPLALFAFRIPHADPKCSGGSSAGRAVLSFRAAADRVLVLLFRLRFAVAFPVLLQCLQRQSAL